MKMDLSTELLGVKFKNPVVLGSGILGVTGSSLINVLNNGAGAVISKSISLEERKGHNSPIIFSMENSLINAVGLSNPGIEQGIEEIKYAVDNTNAPIIASIFASTIDEFGEIAKKISKANPCFIEVNISCPNVEQEFGKPFACDPEIASEVTKIVKKNTSIPIIIKLSPNVQNIGLIAKEVEKAGADMISAINTVGPGMVIDINTAKPILHNKAGGLSGPAIKPIAVRCVYDIYENVKIPILGVGGITYGKDAIEMIMAGASLVGIGSAVHFRGIDVFKKVCDEMEKWLEEKKYSSYKEIIGIAHK